MIRFINVGWFSFHSHYRWLIAHCLGWDRCGDASSLMHLMVSKHDLWRTKCMDLWSFQTLSCCDSYWWCFSYVWVLRLSMVSLFSGPVLWYGWVSDSSSSYLVFSVEPGCLLYCFCILLICSIKHMHTTPHTNTHTVKIYSRSSQTIVLSCITSWFFSFVASKC